MKLGRVLKTALKWAPVIYPIVRKVMAKKKRASTTIQKR
ncbi:hypothetical protein H4683_003005 [Filibacter limicola]|uniref:Uncharacterized protein n=1 Tax=Sporosarcina limicola TaxID=34101 RepID=A0A927RE17_9BACL|nr:hypothetical protein [Sporosarcina limicola]